MITVA